VTSKKKIRQKSTNDEEYELSRFKPLLRTILEDHVAGKLDSSLFPYTKEAPSAAALPAALKSPPPQATSLRSQKPSWHRAAKPGAAATEARERILVFIAGGMTYSEIRECYQLSTTLNKDIFIGSTHTITPRHFIDDLKVLDLGGVGSRAIPNGIPEGRQEKRAFQEYYDEKYFTKDPPPRARAPATLPVPQEKKPSRLSPTHSFASSVNSTEPPQKEEKKKEERVIPILATFNRMIIY